MLNVVVSDGEVERVDVEDERTRKSIVEHKSKSSEISLT
jgi:hypothetical protein